MKKIVFLTLLTLAVISNSKSQSFQEMSKEMGISHFLYSAGFVGGGVAIFDYNNDGWLDLFMTGGIYMDKLYRNEGNGKFTNVSQEAGLRKFPRGPGAQTMGVTTGDFNNDGFEDIYVTLYNNYTDLLYKNLGNGTFTEMAIDAGFKPTPWSMGACFVDINLDGYLDIYTTVYSTNTQNIANEKHRLYINNKNETFTDQTEKYGLTANATFGLAVHATDFDNDNDLDIMVANDFGFLLLPNQLYENMYPLDTLHEISAAAGVNAAIFGMGIGAADIDEDGDMDYYVTNIGKNLFYRNNGNKTFTNIAPESGIEHGFVGTLRSTSWSPVFIDYDNDSHLDFALTNGFVGEANTSLLDPNKLYHNNGDGKFTDVSVANNFADSTKSRGLAMGDLNNDGSMDLVVVNLETDPTTTNRNRVYINQNKQKNNWFKLKLEGTTTNRSAIGARAIAYAGGRLFLREVEGGGGSHLSESSKIQHWGLEKYTKIDSLKIIWPGGATQVFKNLPVNVQMNVIQNTKAELVTMKSVTLCKGETYDGVPYLQSMNFENKSTLASGMDSIAKFYITVNPTYDVKSNVGICQGDLYRNLAITKDTVIVDNLKTKSGCDSICTYNVTLHTPVTVSKALSFCDVAQIDGQNYTSSKTITTKGKSIFGCDSTSILDVTVNKSQIGNASVVICAGDTYKNVVYNESKSLIETFQTVAGCDSIVTVAINVKPIPQGFKDTLIHIGDTYDGIQYNETKTYTFNNKIIKGAANGCDSIFVLQLRVQPIGSVKSENEFASLKVQTLGNNEYQFVYSLAKDSPVSISLLNSNGAIVQNFDLGEKVIGEYKLSFNSSNIAKGAYFITMKLNSGVLTQKLVIVE